MLNPASSPLQKREIKDKYEYQGCAYCNVGYLTTKD